MNKKIAELKGLCLHEWNSEAPIHQVCQHCGIRGIDDYGEVISTLDNPDWLHNISDAWELFEELPRPTLVKRIDGSYGVYLPPDSVGYQYDAKTATEAICLAYISWRENENNQK